MSSSIMGLVLSALLANTSASHLPAWQLDYHQAHKLAAREQKPLAVVLGQGAANWDRIVAGGELSVETAQTLRTAYVCVYIDTQTPEGQKLAAAFEVKTSAIVISDKTGDLQAFRHEGKLADADLQRTAVHYADPARLVRTTDTAVPVTTTSHYQAAPEPTIIRYQAAPVTATSHYQPAPAATYQQAPPTNYYPYAPSGGSCPNCRPSYR